jgi:hypothetical protein
VRDLAAHHANGDAQQWSQVGNEQDLLDRIPLPESQTWPELSPDALYGLAGDVVGTIAPQSEADPAALLVQLLVAFGSAVGRGPFYQVEGDAHHTNLFACLVGSSAKGRKGVSWGRILEILSIADAIWRQRHIASGLSSGEGLIWSVRDAITKREPIKERGRVVGHQNVITDEGVSDKRLLVEESEFGQTLRVLRREGNTLSPVIRLAWDRGDLRILTKNSPAQATGAHISILGHITQLELLNYLDDAELFNGFANRFLWICVRRRRSLPDGGLPIDLTSLAGRVSAALRYGCQVTNMCRTPAAAERWQQLYDELTADRPGLYGTVTARAEAQVLRLSLLYALMDNAAAVDVQHLQAALALWQYCSSSARYIFGERQETDPLEALFLGALRAAPEGLTRRDLYQTASGHIRAPQLISTMARLRDRGLAVCQTEPTRGRPAERWFAPEHLCAQSEESGQSAEVSTVAAPDLTPRDGRSPAGNPGSYQTVWL